MNENQSATIDSSVAGPQAQQQEPVKQLQQQLGQQLSLLEQGQPQPQEQQQLQQPRKVQQHRLQHRGQHGNKSDKKTLNNHDKIPNSSGNQGRSPQDNKKPSGTNAANTPPSGHAGDGMSQKSMTKQTPQDHKRAGNVRMNRPKQQNQKQQNQKQQNQQNFVPFAPYLTKKEVQEGLKRSTMIQGPVRINPKSFQDAFVPHPDGHSDVYISGIADRNRALNTDVVCVLLYPEAKWKIPQDLLTEKKETKSEVAEGNAATSIKQQATAFYSMADRYVNVEDVPDTVRANIPTSALLKTGKVVYIIEKKHSRACTGFIKALKNGNRAKAWFAPIDHRLPRLNVQGAACPQGFFERPDDFKETLFVARIVDWKEDSPFAEGELTRSLGEAGQIEPESEGFLIEYGIRYEEFSEEVLKDVPSDLPWRIPSEELETRRDLRKECIFTIDPVTARDLDDSLSCVLIRPGVYEVGVHIADVSYFIQPESALDREACSRSTSVYLVQKVIPMLPRILCEHLCSLNPNEDKLTFSVIWEITEEGEILSEWFGRTVIRSCAKLGYNHAQGMIEEPTRDWTESELPEIYGGFTSSQIRDTVLRLNNIAQALRKKRFDEGALRLDQIKLQFSLDKETGLPNGWSVYEQKDSNRLVEEFMLLANMAVARKIYSKYHDLAVLRRHPPPQTRQIDDLLDTCTSLGIELNISSAGSLQKSLSKLAGTDEISRGRLQVVISLCSKPMQMALYFCTGTVEDEEEYRHYALNVPFYTHFTSPIRRYPDVLVHRQLAAALGLKELPDNQTKESLGRWTEHSNDMKTASKRVQELSTELFFSVFIKECGPIDAMGTVMGVLDKSFDVLIVQFGVIKRVYCEQLPLSSYTHDKESRPASLELVWAAVTDQPGTTKSLPAAKQTISVFTRLPCRLVAGSETLKWNLEIPHPNAEE